MQNALSASDYTCRELIFYQDYIVTNLSIILFNSSFRKALECFDFLNNSINKERPNNLNLEVHNALQALIEYPNREKAHANIFNELIQFCTQIFLKELRIISLNETSIIDEVTSNKIVSEPHNSEHPIAHFVTYQIKEVFGGISDSINGTINTFAHPIQSVQNTVKMVQHPITTAKSIGQSFYNNPARSLSNAIVGFYTGKLISSAVLSTTKLPIKTKSITKITNKLENILENTNKAAEKASIASEVIQNTRLTEFSRLNLQSTIREAVQNGNINVANQALTRSGLQYRAALLESSRARNALDTAQKASVNIGKTLKTFKTLEKSNTILINNINTSTQISSMSVKLSNFSDKAEKEHLIQTYRERIMHILQKALFDFTCQYILKKFANEKSLENVLHHELPMPKNLVFEGGGPKGVVYVGALRVLEENGYLSNIERVGGTSAGAITALLLSVGYGIAEIEKLLQELNMEEFLDDERIRSHLFTLIDQYKAGDNFNPLISDQEIKGYAAQQINNHRGLFSGEILRQWLEDRVVEKLEQYKDVFPDKEAAKLATFADLEKIKVAGGSIKTLAVIGSNISKHSPAAETFSALETPNALIVDAVRISLSIPGIFYPHKAYMKKDGKRTLLKDDLYIDGGVFKNYPIDIFDKEYYRDSKFPDNKHYNSETIGLRIEADIALYEAFLQGNLSPERIRRNRVSTQNSAFFSVLKYLVPGTLALLEASIKLNDEIQLFSAITFSSQQASYQTNIDCWKRTIYISPSDVDTLDFNIPKDKKEELIKNGKIGVKAFLARTIFLGKANEFDLISRNVFNLQINNQNTSFQFERENICNREAISSFYWYEDAEMNRILQQEREIHACRTADGRALHILGPLDNLSPYGLAETLMAHNRQQGVILLPFNLGQLHWIGLMLEYDATGQMIQANYYDSLEGNIPSYLNAILAGLAHGKNAFTVINRANGLILQENGSDCGPCTIENLLAAVGYREQSGTNNISRRLRHLQLLESAGDKNFYSNFYTRQSRNQSSFTKEGYQGKNNLGSVEYEHLLSLALMIMDLEPNIQKALKDALLPITNADKDQEHKLQLTKIRSALNPNLTQSSVIDIAKIFFCFDIKAINLDAASLKIDYNQIAKLHELLSNPKKEIEDTLDKTISAKSQNERDQLLFEASRLGDIIQVERLIKCGAAVNSQHTDKRIELNGNIHTYKGKTPLFIASEMGHVKVVKLLLDNKANRELRDSGSWRPYDVALVMQHQYGRKECSECVSALSHNF